MNEHEQLVFTIDESHIHKSSQIMKKMPIDPILNLDYLTILDSSHTLIEVA